jgi:hypothetical protein
VSPTPTPTPTSSPDSATVKTIYLTFDVKECP